MEDFNFKTKPYKHQLKQFEAAKDLEYFALFNEMGTGKSKIAIDVAVYKYEKELIDAVLVIAPNHVHTQWVAEQFPIHCAVPYEAVVWNATKRKTISYENMLEEFLTPKNKKLKVFAVNVEAFQFDSIIPYIAAYVKHNKVFTIIDEATRIKTPTAKRSKTIHKLEKYGHRCILTGTPATKSPFGLWSMFEFLKKNYFNCNFFIFQARHGVMIQGTNNQTGARYKTLIDEKTWNIASSKIKKIAEMRGGLLMPDDYTDIAYSTGLSEKNIMFIEKQKTFKKYKRLDELKESIEKVTFYAKKEDCLDLPDKIYETVYIDMDKEHKKIYTTLKKQLLVQYEGEELTVLNKISLTTRLMQICGGFFPYAVDIEDENGNVIREAKAKVIGKKNQKIERIKEELDEVSSFPIIIWAKFVAELDAIYQAFKNDYKCALYYGKTSTADRQSIIEDFKVGKYDIFIGNAATAGFGLNLQNATTQFYFSNGFNVEERLQAEDRSHRMGVKSNCTYKDFVYKGTIDEKITRAIVDGRDMNDFFRTQSLQEIINE